MRLAPRMIIESIAKVPEAIVQDLQMQITNDSAEMYVRFECSRRNTRDNR